MDARDEIAEALWAAREDSAFRVPVLHVSTVLWGRLALLRDGQTRPFATIDPPELLGVPVVIDHSLSPGGWFIAWRPR